jgi:hypothetical protein
MHKPKFKSGLKSYQLSNRIFYFQSNLPLLTSVILKERQNILTPIMLGSFQQSQLRIEVEASETTIQDSLLCPGQIQKWLWPQRLASGMPEKLHSGLNFTSWIGPVAIHHQVQVATPICLRLLIYGGIDGFHEWYWGEGWVQSRLEGISLLPLNLGQTLSLLRLRQFLAGDRKV